MPIVRLYGITAAVPASRVMTAARAVRKAIEGIPAFTGRNISVHVPAEYGFALPETLKLTAFIGVFPKAERTAKVRKQLSDAVADAIHEAFPEYDLSVFVHDLDEASRSRRSAGKADAP